MLFSKICCGFKISIFFWSHICLICQNVMICLYVYCCIAMQPQHLSCEAQTPIPDPLYCVLLVMPKHCGIGGLAWLLSINQLLKLRAHIFLYIACYF